MDIAFAPSKPASGCVAGWVVAAAVLALAGCVTVPVGPSMGALPGSHTPWEIFQGDDFACREYAQRSINPDAAARAAAEPAVAGTAIGAVIGALIGSATGDAGPGAAIGAGTGLLFGSAVGSDAAWAMSHDLQRRYDDAYFQCMYARGNRVPGPPRVGWVDPRPPRAASTYRR